jgi:hypothetical protein
MHNSRVVFDLDWAEPPPEEQSPDDLKDAPF